MDAQEERQARRAGRCPAKLPPLTKTLWWRDLTEEGVEPHPGPRWASNSRGTLFQTLLTLNIGGTGNMWKFLQHLPDIHAKLSACKKLAWDLRKYRLTPVPPDERDGKLTG